MTVVIPEVPSTLLERYGGAVPRYTSYPTAVDWRDDVRPEDYPGLLKLMARRRGPVSVYVHVPFCEKRCLFCGCSVTVTRDRSRGDAYVETVERELETLVSHGAGRRPVTQLHWGGGTPTWLTEGQIRRLHAALTEAFDVRPNAELAIEVDPRVTTLDQVLLLAELGFDRLSMGVQDLDPAVQEAIGRVQDTDYTRRLMDTARGAGFRSVNVDLIQGLPGQSRASFAKTLDGIVEWRPDRIALFHYAHVPWLQKHHRAIDITKAPSPQEKVGIVRDAVASLQAAGYVFLGLDHFSLREDELAVASREGRLGRNFMGYTVNGGEDLIGLGASAIGQVSGTYVQAPRDVASWTAAVKDRGHGVVKGHRLTHDDRVRRRVIMDLMCNGRVRKTAIEAEFGLMFDASFDDEIGALEKLAQDGLVELRSHEIVATPLGRLFIRSIAAVFDPHRQKRAREEARFSRAF